MNKLHACGSGAVQPGKVGAYDDIPAMVIQCENVWTWLTDYSP